jgi:MYXO-CTERM domain-containing protein
LYADAGGHPSSIPLEDWLNKTAPDTPSACLSEDYVTVEYEGFHTSWNGVLLGGQQYWIVAEPIDNTTSVLWNSSQNLGADVVEFTNGALGGVWGAPQTSNGVAFDVLGSPLVAAPTPEPASGVFVPLGLAALFLLRMMRRASSR